jgi:hypothetical protein
MGDKREEYLAEARSRMIPGEVNTVPAPSPTPRRQMMANATEILALAARVEGASGAAELSCTCHPDDRPSGPCQQRYAASECQMQRLKWNVPDNLRWLAEQDHRPDYMPCGMLTGVFLTQVAEMVATKGETE